MRKLETTLNNILDLISCSYDYGFADDVLFDAFSDMINHELKEYEIDWFIEENFLEKDGYGEEDKERSKEILMSFKYKYIDV